MNCFHRFDMHFTNTSALPSSIGTNPMVQASQTFMATSTSLTDPSWYMDSRVTQTPLLMSVKLIYVLS